VNNIRRKTPMCPKCKGHETYDIIPQLPNELEFQLQAFDFFFENYTIGNARYFCIDCNYEWKKYRGKKPYDRIKVIHADINGYPGPNYQVRIDLNEKKVDHYTSFYERNIRAGKDSKRLQLNEIEWFLCKLYECDIVNWAEVYEVNGFVNDGTNWSVRIEYDTYCEIKLGNNHFPTKWTKFCKAVSKLSENEFC
jgi:hypothetical protein